MLYNIALTILILVDMSLDMSTLVQATMVYIHMEVEEMRVQKLQIKIISFLLSNLCCKDFSKTCAGISVALVRPASF